jgi:hypothetical protein
MAQCFEISLLPTVKPSHFEKVVFTEVFPHLQILSRNARRTIHRLLKIDGTESAPHKYVWLVFSILGGTPENEGEGPQVLESNLGFVDRASQLLAQYATVASFTEITAPEHPARHAHS